MCSPATIQAVDQSIFCFGPGSRVAGSSAALGRFCCLGPESHGARRSNCFGPELRSACWSSRFGPVGGAASLCSRCTPTHPRFQVWVPRRRLRCGRPAGVSVVGPQSANLGAHNRASGEHWGCLSRVHSPGAEGGGAPQATAAAESSLISC